MGSAVRDQAERTQARGLRGTIGHALFRRIGLC